MASYQVGRKQARMRPWCARVWADGRHNPPLYLGYYKTRGEATAIEETVRHALKQLQSKHGHAQQGSLRGDQPA